MRSAFFRAGLVVLIACGSLIAIFVLAIASLRNSERQRQPPPVHDTAIPRRIVAGDQLDVWWDGLPGDLLERSHPTGTVSNIHPSDYVGSDACKQCHERNHESWTSHPHHWMNAAANSATVKGDFSGKKLITYRGTQASFGRDGEGYWMRLERGEAHRTYEITQTIGSRYFQYYVGKQTQGPEPKSHHFYSKEHVLPFGYWLSAKQWVPTVHIGPELPDEERPDSFSPPDKEPFYAEYAAGCNYCHTTFPLADMFARSAHRMGEHAPTPLHWSLRGYLEESHPEMVNLVSTLLDRRAEMMSLSETDSKQSEMKDRNVVPNPMTDWEASKYGVSFGISCEACHLGGREHVESGGKVPPKFFPSSPYLYAEHKGTWLDFGRTHENVNWACGRCHTGGRPQYAAGMATWNSVEYTDAMRGSCYSRLRCIDCHNPHRATGPKWSHSADHDDSLCLKCHEKFQPDKERIGHTHHPLGSQGARCMNCHMPRINEGLEGMVRTHMIYSPNRTDMIEANHPNACNQCHTQQPIDWTLRYLSDWYGTKFDPGKIATNYAADEKGVAFHWLESKNTAVRMVGVDSLLRARDLGALPQLFNALDDPYLLNRQFASRGLEDLLDTRLSSFGYQFYMSKEERRGPLAELRSRFIDSKRLSSP
jgi:predicted CXXCH cytochrome family protein